MSKKENGNPKPRVAISKAVLLDEGLDKKAVRRELAECVGCGDEANTETAEGHMKTTLVTDRELKQSQDGKVLIRCAACKNEHDTRKRNAKKVCEHKESIRKIDDLLKQTKELKLNEAQVKLLEGERVFCVGEVKKGFTTEQEAMEFIG